MKKRSKLSLAEQSARFIEAAKKAEADERPKEFDKVFKRVAAQKKTRKTSE